ncbi:DNA-binding transcriptional LysR family regulator [Rhodopseudomonas julia]|uniref:DNA-binding transcriptional LysR family regulator n=1 Tax=Rhodopseudomonas julia TaxID=200617 RepID=A0ABU0C8X6_9BRAD|nr:LysR family transcriptional regulator [Rhodopseudomonas julia]MDQ0326988.1 DNA-binding transcriptional LysR family regulator [Rhodopseudomonas julia]
MNITLKQVRYFIAVASSQSVSLAARDLHISQSAITVALKQLEQEVGAALFLRTPRGMVLTQEGHQFLRHSERIMAVVADAGRALKVREPTGGGTLTIGVTALVAGYYLADLLARYQRVYPEVDVKVVEDQQRFLEHLLIGGEIDVGLLISSALANRDALASDTLLRSPYLVWLPANHRLLALDEPSLSDLADQPLVQLTTDDMHAITQRHWREAGIKPRTVLRTSSVEAIRSLVGTGIGLAVLPDMTYRPWSLEGDRVEVRPLKEVFPTIDIGLTWRKGSLLPEPARAFIELAREQAKLRARQSRPGR